MATLVEQFRLAEHPCAHKRTGAPCQCGSIWRRVRFQGRRRVGTFCAVCGAKATRKSATLVREWTL